MKALVLCLFMLATEAVRGAPVTYDELTLKDGEVLHNVTIVAVGSSTVMARWDGGRGTIRIDNLPEGIVPAVRTQVPTPAAPAPPRRAEVKAEPPAEGAPIQAPAKYFNTPWQNETQYIVDTIASDLTEMAYYAKYRRALHVDGLPAVATYAPSADATGELFFVVQSSLGADGQCTCVLPIKGPIWAPETYQPLTAALFTKLGLAGARGDDSDTSEIVHDLLEPTVERLVSTDASESSRLAASFTSAAAHERAALLMAAFEMREADGKFYQARFELCRMAAHLAFAQALAGGPPETTAGKVAKALLTVLYNNEASALALADAFPPDGDSKAWQRVVRMRATSDYRIYKSVQLPTLAERFEFMRSLGQLDMDKAWEEVHLGQEEAVRADWWRIASSHGHSVQLGHQILAVLIPAELHEEKVAYDAETLSSFTTAGIKALNAEPGRCVTSGEDGGAVVRVIGWGTWAAFLQRELCAAVAGDFHFLHDSWGVPDSAADFLKKADDQFWELRLYPLVRRQNATEKNYYHQAQDDEIVLVHNCPQALPAEAWNDISYAPRALERYVPPPHPFINEWHNPNPPPGTAYNISPRMNHPSLTSRGDFLEELERLHALAPYDSTISYQLIYKKYSHYPPREKVEEVYRNVIDYQPRPCLWMAELSGGEPQAYEKWMRKAIEINPKFGNLLATYYASRGRDEEAVREYEQWLGVETDDVLVSNQVEWLVEYKERHGDEAGANALAMRAYKTGSATGMLTMAHLIEGRKLYEAAYRIYAEVRERYNESIPMVAFLERMRRIGSDSRRDSLRENLMKTLVPEGLVAASDPGTQPPTSGAQVKELGDESAVSDLRWNDVIVAANGYRVPNVRTLSLVRALDPGAKLTLTVWRDGKYLTVPARVEHFVRFTPPLSNFKG